MRVKLLLSVLLAASCVLFVQQWEQPTAAADANGARLYPRLLPGIYEGTTTYGFNTCIATMKHQTTFSTLKFDGTHITGFECEEMADGTVMCVQFLPAKKDYCAYKEANGLEITPKSPSHFVANYARVVDSASKQCFDCGANALIVMRRVSN